MYDRSSGMSRSGQAVRWTVVIAAGAALLFATATVLAATPGAGEIDWFSMGTRLLGGLALFLYGMEKMSESLKFVAGDGMKMILAKLTDNRIMGLLTGAFVTAIIQSSSVTTVMLVGFVTAGLMSLSQAIGVILGADIGTTITAQIVAFKVTKYALVLVAVGFLLFFTGKSDRIRQYGNLIMGLGMIFFGMGIMSDGMRPLRDFQPFLDLMQNVSNPLVGILVAALFTALIQSSSATMGVVIALALQGLVTLEGGVALALGANIGTCATAALAAIGKPREAVRVAVAHVTFKIAGVLLIVGVIPQFVEFVRYISPAEAGLTGLDRLAAETPRQIANAHTLFNVGIALTFLPFASLFARFCEWVVPDKPLVETDALQPRYLDEELLKTPALALDGARRELGRAGSRAQAMLEKAIPAIASGNQPALASIAKMDEEIDTLHRHIIAYLGRVSQVELTEARSRDLIGLMEAANDLESIGDLIETDLVELGTKRIDAGVTISERTRQVLAELGEAVIKATNAAVCAVADNDAVAARRVIAMKAAINLQVDTAALHEARRLVAEEPNRLAAYRIETEVIDRLKRIFYYAKRMAKTVPGTLANASQEVPDAMPARAESQHADLVHVAPAAAQAGR